MVVAAYRIKVDRWLFADAEAGIQSFCLRDIWQELNEFIRDRAKSPGK